MKKLLFYTILVNLLLLGCSRTTTMQKITIPFEQNPNQTLTYTEIIDCYQKMATLYPSKLHLSTMGSTDIGEPMHVAVLSKDGVFNPEKIKQSGRRILLINNGIHPGEPEGIDATILLLRDLLTNTEYQHFLDHLVIVFIPVYNVDGCINRNSHSRANQNGPESYGFRGNARNYDLNRDFVKTDSRNARAFNAIFSHWMPDIFIDNHTSNGADYQYTMTLIPTLHSKLEAPLGEFLTTKMLPFLFKNMKERKWEMIPYVDTPGPTPETGIINFCDYGRYSTGYAALWNTIGFMPETHMLKPFADRLESTRQFMEVVIAFIHENHAEIGKKRAEAFDLTQKKTQFHLDYAMDASRHDSILFKGYEAKYKPSEVSGLPRLWYDRSAPYEKMIPYYNYFNPTVSIDKPTAYIVPQAWENVIQRLENNQVNMTRLTENLTINVESYKIGKVKNREAWEGHYYHSKVEVEKLSHERKFYKGDYVIYVNQNANRYIVETLEPQAPDSYFAWNFFDPILMQKEYFSDYVFEDTAAKFLKDHPDVKTALETKKSAYPEFANNAAAQLDWVYRQSPWYEPMHRIYPVARLVDEGAIEQVLKSVNQLKK